MIARVAFRAYLVSLLFAFSLLIVSGGVARSGEDPKTFVPPDDALLLGYAKLGGEGDAFLAETLYTGVKKGSFTSLIQRNHSVPAGNGQVFGVGADDSSIVLTILKGTNPKFEDNPLLARVSIPGVPSRPGDTGRIAVYLYVGSDGKVLIWARNHKTGTKLKVRLQERVAGGE